MIHEPIAQLLYRRRQEGYFRKGPRILPRSGPADTSWMAKSQMTPASWVALSEATEEMLYTLGCRYYGPLPPSTDTVGQVPKDLWLIPVEWWRELPDDTEVWDSFGRKHKASVIQSPRSLPNGVQFGCLPYGFLRDRN